jgi:hypothetical protein
MSKMSIMSKKRDVLHHLSFGNQIAEEEKDTLKDYFVQTASWQKILRGEIDVIYGPKGAGKSAIYVLIQDYADYLFDKNVLLVSAENIRGDPAFKSLTLDPPTTEREFTNLWKLYFVTLNLSKISNTVTWRDDGKVLRTDDCEPPNLKPIIDSRKK